MGVVFEHFLQIKPTIEGLAVVLVDRPVFTFITRTLIYLHIVDGLFFNRDLRSGVKASRAAPERAGHGSACPAPTA